MSIALMLHILAAVVWIGGMFFAYALLRPVLSEIDSRQRLTIWANTFKKFFPWVWVCIFVLLLSGFYMINLMGGFAEIGLNVYLMIGFAFVMILVFKFIYVAPFRHLCRGVDEQKWEVAAYALGTIRKLVAVNLAFGVLTIIVATTLKEWTW